MTSAYLMSIRGAGRRASSIVHSFARTPRVTAIEPQPQRWQFAVLVAIVALPICFNAIMLRAELRGVPSVNDDAFHYLMMRSDRDAIAAGENPLDNWGPEMDLGAPRWLSYQNLPAAFVIAADRVTFGHVGLLKLFNITRYLLLLALPLTTFWALRRMEFSRVAAAGAAAAVSLVSTDYLYGIDYNSFVWRGWGLYTQLWAMHLSLITMGCLWRLGRTGRGIGSAIAAASLLVLSHLLYAEMMIVTGAIVLVASVDRQHVRRRAVQVGLFGLVVAAITSYIWVSFLQNGPYNGESPYDAAYKLDSFGAGPILRWLVTGQLFDAGRLPIFTLLGAIGVVGVLFTRTRQGVMAVVLFSVWLVLYFGRQVWGPLADHLPVGSMLLFHRFIGPVHVAGILLIGLGFEWVWRACRRLPPRVLPVGAFVAFVLLLMPAFVERNGFYADNTRWIHEVGNTLNADTEAQRLIATLHALPPGRVYAGLRSNWGETMRVDQIPWYRLLVFEGFSVVSPPLPSINLNSDLMFHFDEQNAAHYQLFDVRYVLAPRGQPLPAFLTPLTTTSRYTLYRAPSDVPAMFASSTVAKSARTKFDLFFANRSWLLGDDPATRTFIRWHYPSSQPVAAVSTPGCTDGGDVRQVLWQPNHVEVAVNCATASTLVLKWTYHPNWHVMIDGQERPTYMVSPSYIGVDVSAGPHEVRADYRSSRLRTSLELLGLVVALGSAGWLLLGDRLRRMFQFT